MRIFITGFLQVFFVILSTYLVQKQNIVGVGLVGFCIVIIWCLNVKKISIGTWEERLYYAFGSSFGSMLSLWLSGLYL